MAYFTDDKTIADNYSNSKADTSLAYEEGAGDYFKQFKITVNGKKIPVGEAWKNLSFEERNDIRKNAGHVTFDDDYENIILSEDTDRGLGNFDDYLLREHKGNYLNALVDSWLQSGELIDEEERFKEVLALAGLKSEVEYDDPNKVDRKTYSV